MRKIEHIGIAVKDIAASNEIFSALLGVKPYKEEADLIITNNDKFDENIHQISSNLMKTKRGRPFHQI